MKMNSSTWYDGLIPKHFIPDKLELELEGTIEDGIWGEETKLTIIPSNISVKIFKKIISQLSLDIDINKKNLTTHFIEYNINSIYEITKHNDNCDLTVIVYLNKDHTMKDTFYICDKKFRKDKWETKDNSYSVLAFNGYDEHWGKLEGSGERTILVFHYYF